MAAATCDAMARSRLLLMALMALMAAEASTDSAVPQARSATSHSLTVRVPCIFEKKCNLVSLKYKKKDVDSFQSASFDNERDTIIRALDNNTEYKVRTEVEYHDRRPTSAKTVVMWTCPEELPPVEELRAAKTGPGWLDLRWSPVKDEKCRSNVYYHVRYGTEKNLGDWMVYGVFNNTLGGEKVFRPTHPCAVWDADFCLLLTDEVTPREKYRIFVKPVRYDPELSNLSYVPHDSPVVANLTAEANASNTGWYALGYRDERTPECVPRAPAPPPPERDAPRTWPSPSQHVVVPVWAIIVAGVALALAVTLFVVARLRRRSSLTSPLLHDAPPAGDSAPCDPRCSKIYDDCESAGHMGRHTLPLDPTAQHEEPVYDCVKNAPGPPGMQAVLLGELSAAVAAKSLLTASPKPAPASNHYVCMTSSQGIYDDIRPTYSNVPADRPDSNIYMDPGSPMYDEASGVHAQEDRKSETSVGYNRPYSLAKTKPWRAW